MRKYKILYFTLITCFVVISMLLLWSLFQMLFNTEQASALSIIAFLGILFSYIPVIMMLKKKLHGKKE